MLRGEQIELVFSHNSIVNNANVKYTTAIEN